MGKGSKVSPLIGRGVSESQRPSAIRTNAADKRDKRIQDRNQVLNKIPVPKNNRYLENDRTKCRDAANDRSWGRYPGTTFFVRGPVSFRG